MMSAFVMQLLGESRTVLVDRMVRHGEDCVHVVSLEYCSGEVNNV